MTNNLWKLREIKKIDAEEMASKIGISSSQYYKYEEDELQLPLDVAKNIADEFDTTLDFIYCRVKVHDSIPTIVNDFIKAASDDNKDKGALKRLTRKLLNTLEDYTEDDEREPIKERRESMPRWRKILKNIIEDMEKRYNITRTYIAAKAEIDIKTLNNYIDDSYNYTDIKLQTLIKLVKGLNISLDTVLRGETLAYNPKFVKLSNAYADLDSYRAKYFQQFMWFICHEKD